MFLTHLSLTDFRIFSRFDQAVPLNSLILVGDNAQGKTSLLEAVYYLSTLDSFQASNSLDLINFSALQNDLAVCRIVAERQRLIDGLGEMGLEVGDSQSNFILAGFERISAGDVYAKLCERKIYVRYFKNEKQLADKLRISIGTAEQNDALLAALREIMA